MKRSSSSLSQRKGDYVSTGSMDDYDEEKDETKSRVSNRKSRNLSEKKRRDQFNMLINELCSMVSNNNQKMDKSTVLRSTISFLRNHNDISIHPECPDVGLQENWKPSFLSNEEFTHLMLEALDGFIIVFSTTGRILYMSESITSLLGYMPNDISSSIFEVVHESDKPALFKLLNSSPNSNDMHQMDVNGNCLSLSLHMKHGPLCSSESHTYELVRLMGTFHHWSSSAEADYDSNSCSSVCSPVMPATSAEWRSCFVAMARFQNPQLLREMTVSDGSKNEFVSRHSLEWKFLFLDHRAPPIIGYLPFEVLGTSGYDYYHIDDLDRVAGCHEALMQTGEGTSCYYRFLTKGQQWIWLQTRYFITYHQWNSKPEFIVCTHTVISYEEVQNSFQKDAKQNECNSEGFQKVDSLSTQVNITSLPTNHNARQSPAPSAGSRCSMSSRGSDISSVTSSMKPSVQNTLSSRPQCSLVLSPVNRPPVLGVNQKGVNLVHQSSDNNQHSYSNHTAANNTLLPSDHVTQEQHIQPTLVTIEAVPTLMEVDTHALRMNNAEQESCTERPSSANSLCSMDTDPNNSKLQDYLKRRHQLLQQQILFQQEELRRVSEQLMLVQFVAPNLAVTTIPYQGNAGLGTMTIANQNGTMLQTQSAQLTIQHPQIITQQLLLQPQIPETMTSTSIPKSTISTTTAIINQSPGVQVLAANSHLMPLPLSQEQAQVVFAQGFNTNPQHGP